MARDFALVRFIPKNMGFPFVKWRKPAFVLSALAMLASVALLVIQGLNFGIDFVAVFWSKPRQRGRLILLKFVN